MASNRGAFEVQDNVQCGNPHDVNSFTVIAEDTEGCRKIGVKGALRLQVAGDMIKLLSYDTGKDILSCPLYDMRTFGFSSLTFFIQTGKRCRAGEAKLTLLTAEGEAIVKLLNDHAEEIVAARGQSKTAKTTSSGSSARSSDEAGTSLTEEDKISKGIFHMGIRKSLEETITVDGQQGERNRAVTSFTVMATNTAGCHKIGVKGVFRLQVEGNGVKLLSYDTGKEILSWSLYELRSFGFSPRTFAWHAGRRSKTGECKIILLTTEGEAIANLLRDRATQLKKQGSPSTVVMPSGSANAGQSKRAKASPSVQQHKTRPKIKSGQNSSTSTKKPPQSQEMENPYSTPDDCYSTLDDCYTTFENPYATLDHLYDTLDDCHDTLDHSYVTLDHSYVTPDDLYVTPENSYASPDPRHTTSDHHT